MTNTPTLDDTLSATANTETEWIDVCDFAMRQWHAEDPQGTFEQAEFE